MNSTNKLLAAILDEVSTIRKTIEPTALVETDLGLDGLPAAVPTRQIVDIDASYILELKQYLNLNEFDHKEELKQLLWGNIDPEQTPWCASALTGALENVGIDSPKSNLSTDYATWGQPCPPMTVGAIPVWRGHVGVYLGNGDVIGGNQSNELNIMKMNHIRRDEPIAWRIPPDWELPT